jgi:hypothetical protein
MFIAAFTSARHVTKCSRISNTFSKYRDGISLLRVWEVPHSNFNQETVYAGWQKFFVALLSPSEIVKIKKCKVHPATVHKGPGGN